MRLLFSLLRVCSSPFSSRFITLQHAVPYIFHTLSSSWNGVASSSSTFLIFLLFRILWFSSVAIVVRVCRLKKCFFVFRSVVVCCLSPSSSSLVECGVNETMSTISIIGRCFFVGVLIALGRTQQRHLQIAISIFRPVSAFSAIIVFDVLQYVRVCVCIYL